MKPADVLAGLERSFRETGEQEIHAALSLAAGRLAHYRRELLSVGIDDEQANLLVRDYHTVLLANA